VDNWLITVDKQGALGITQADLEFMSKVNSIYGGVVLLQTLDMDILV
jgi:hypothetical protein